MLQEKHPPLADPTPSPDGRGAFEPYPRTPTSLPLRCSSDTVESVASRLGGSAGPGGVDAYSLANWLCRFGTSSKALRAEVAHWVEWLSNTNPPWVAYLRLQTRQCPWRSRPRHRQLPTRPPRSQP